MQKYILDIGKTPDRKEFVEWLLLQGHAVNWPHRPTAQTYVDGFDVTLDQGAAEIYQELWNNFIASKEEKHGNQNQI
jgi:hypothetical protein